MQITQPTASPSNATPQADTSAGAAGTTTAYSRGDHSHPFATGVMTFQNAADAGKKFQRVVTGQINTNTGVGAVAMGTAAISWPATFASTPTAVLGNTNITTQCWPGGLDTVTTTGANSTLMGQAVGAAGKLEVWGLG